MIAPYVKSDQIQRHDRGDSADRRAAHLDNFAILAVGDGIAGSPGVLTGFRGRSASDRERLPSEHHVRVIHGILASREVVLVPLSTHLGATGPKLGNEHIENRSNPWTRNAG